MRKDRYPPVLVVFDVQETIFIARVAAKSHALWKPEGTLTESVK
jgi:hypothetical protein